MGAGKYSLILRYFDPNKQEGSNKAKLNQLHCLYFDQLATGYWHRHSKGTTQVKVRQVSRGERY